MARKVTAVLLAACLLISVGLTASAASYTATGAVPSDVVQIFRLYITKDNLFDNYAAVSTSEGEYKLFIGELQLDSGYISSSEEVKVVTVKADQSYDVSSISSLSLSCGSNILYSDLGDYPSLMERGEYFEILQTLLIIVVVLTMLLMRIFGAVSRH